MFEFAQLRQKYTSFIYKSYSIETTKDGYQVAFEYSIEGLSDFTAKWFFPLGEKAINKELLSKLCFNLGMVEMISYWKCACPPVITIKCGDLNEEQLAWWKKLMYNGLGEFMYINGIDISIDELVDIQVAIADKLSISSNYADNTCKMQDAAKYEGCLVPIGGGKDSSVTLSTLKNELITTYSVNRIEAVTRIIDECDYKHSDYLAKRTLDSRMLELNKQGYLNGHTPFSAIVAFSSFISAYITGRKYITLSNETSANESTVKDSFVNHQYSKSYEFEQDFNKYINEITDSDIHYFSLLRPLSEIQIAYLFAKDEKYFRIFRSCNVGSKKGIWCCNCPKCLFVYIILSPFISQEKMVEIFGEDLLNKESNEEYFKELTGIKENKPFECVGTRKEVLVALKAFIEAGQKSYFTEKYSDVIMSEEATLSDMLSDWVDENNVPKQLEILLKRRLFENGHN